MRALVAMSGGVDSSVAAAMTKEAGFDVMGVTLKLWEGPGGEAPTAGCCTVSDAEDARRVAAQLDIPYYVLDYTDEFARGVVRRFISDYATGRTPNPCVECNRVVKFGHLLAGLADLGCDLLVTGHHARIGRDGGRLRLRRGLDAAKDQSYVLAMLTREELGVLSLPVGEMTKAQVREKASALGLRTARKPESMDICFVGSGDYRDFLEGHGTGTAPGPVVDTSGAVVGSHGGVGSFTIGQRRGLGIAAGTPRYVVDIHAPTATVTVGSREDLYVDAVRLEQISWARAGERPSSVDAQYRAHGEAVPARVEGDRLVFDVPQAAVAPGQTVAFYRGDEVVGSAVIRSTSRAGR